MSPDEVNRKLHLGNLDLKSLRVLWCFPERSKACELHNLVQIVCLIQVRLGTSTENLNVVHDSLVPWKALHEETLHVCGDHRNLA